MPNPEFSEVLETACRAAGLDLDAEASADGGRRRRAAASHLQRLADGLFEMAGRLSATATSAESYLEHARETQATRRSKPSDPQSVAEELRITANMSFSDLSRLRREFARANHPDRADLAMRDNATRRMMVANMLIDRELKRRHAPHFTSKR
jgi:hypothetical protein